MNNIIIPRVSQIKFLGLTLSENLSWQEHITNISTKINKFTGLLSKIKNKLNPAILKDLYYSFIYPNITYGITLWGNSPVSHLKPLITSQKSFIRLICNLNPLDSTSSYFETLNILNINNIYIFFTSTFVFKFLHNSLPFYFNEFFKLSHTIQTTSTRHTSTFYTYKTRLKIYYSSIRIAGPKIWDHLLPDNIKQISNFNLFKHKLKLFLISNKKTLINLNII